MKTLLASGLRSPNPGISPYSTNGENGEDGKRRVSSRGGIFADCFDIRARLMGFSFSTGAIFEDNNTKSEMNWKVRLKIGGYTYLYLYLYLYI